ncbi:MAG: hypothetical protein MI923_27145, partial [Phycisphaerales bacterium]|nr:hypothetical protein [Phycisphaerales bacterium]
LKIRNKDEAGCSSTRLNFVLQGQKSIEPAYPGWIDRIGLMDSGLSLQINVLGGWNGWLDGDCCG